MNSNEDYTYAVMCSQVYLEKFRGVLYTPNQSDARARIPFVADKQTFDDVNEELVLKNDEEEIRIHCPLYLQKLSIQIF
jgi:hypothetical protein